MTRLPFCRWPLLLWSLLLWSFFAPNLAAHPLDPCLLELREQGGIVDILWRVPAQQPRRGSLTPRLPDHCEQVGPARIERSDQRVGLRRQADCGDRGLTGEPIVVDGLAERRTDVLLRIHRTDGSTVQAVLRADQPSFIVPEPESTATISIAYLKLGFDHILGGWDHLLFVLGLLFLVQSRRALVATLTAFTLGHSVTLSLAALGFVHLPAPPIEAAIALSILVLAVELAGRKRQSPLKVWPMAAIFGLLHGLGFAGALAETGLPERDIPAALLSFNLGIELGQLAFVAVILALTAAAGRWVLTGGSKALERRLAMPTAYFVGTMSVFWIIERSVGWLA